MKKLLLLHSFLFVFAANNAQICANWVVTPSTKNVPSQGGKIAIKVTNSGACQFSYSVSDASWIKFDSYSSTGLNELNFSILGNSGIARRGYVFINNTTEGISNIATFAINEEGDNLKNFTLDDYNIIASSAKTHFEDIDFYLSDTVIISRILKGGEAVTKQGKLHQIGDTRYEYITFPRLQIGRFVSVSRAKTNASEMYIAFDADYPNYTLQFSKLYLAGENEYYYFLMMIGNHLVYNGKDYVVLDSKGVSIDGKTYVRLLFDKDLVKSQDIDQHVAKSFPKRSR